MECSENNIGRTIGNSFIVRECRAGSMGMVYLCEVDAKTALSSPYAQNQLLALKTLLPPSPSYRLSIKDLEHEADIWMRLGKLPNIVQCFGLEYYDDIPYIVLEWIQGGGSPSLKSRIQKPMSVSRAIQITFQICSGLYQARKQVSTLMHGDLKPDNVLVIQDEPTLVKITDFGLANTAVFQGEIKGKSPIHLDGYRAPERIKYPDRNDIRSDIFSIGSILYHMITGQPYLPDNLSRSKSHRMVDEELPILLLPEVLTTASESTYAINNILARSMNYEINQRYNSLDEMMDDLKAVFNTHCKGILEEINPDEMNAIELANRALSYDYNFHQGERDKEALQDYEKALKIADIGPIRLNLAGYYCDRREFKLALQNIEHAMSWRDAYIEKYGENSESRALRALAYYNRADIYNKLNEYERAIREYTESINLQLQDKKRYSGRAVPYYRLTLADSYNERGNVFEKQGRHDLALEDSKSAVSYAEGDPELIFNLGTSYFQLEMYDDAKEQLIEALYIDDNYAKARFQLALTYSRLGDFISAEKEYENIIKKLVEYNPATEDRLARLRKYDPEEVELLLQKSLLNRATLLIQQHRFNEAITDLKQLLVLNPEHEGAHTNLAIIYISQSQLDKARDHAEHAAELGNDKVLHYIQNNH